MQARSWKSSLVLHLRLNRLASTGSSNPCDADAWVNGAQWSTGCWSISNQTTRKTTTTMQGTCACIPPLSHYTRPLDTPEKWSQKSCPPRWSARSWVWFLRGQFTFQAFNPTIMIVYNVSILCLFSFLIIVKWELHIIGCLWNFHFRNIALGGANIKRKIKRIGD